MHLLNLPPELINSILSYLPPDDLLSCQLTSKYLNTTILSSVGIQYEHALTLASATDSPFSTRPTAEKLGSLKGVEDAWMKMRTDFVLKAEVPLRESGVYDLTGGVYLLSAADRMGLGYTRLPSKGSDQVSWDAIQVGKFIVDVGLCVYEHDLMAIVTSTVRNTSAGALNTFDIEIGLFELSTKKPHPLAQSSTIHVLNCLWEKPSIGIEIVGKHLVLVLSFNAREHPEDRVFIYEWQTGVTIATFEARCHTYGSLIFLDEDHILLPNTRTNTLDIFRIPSAPTLARLQPILQLALPQLIEGRILSFLSCRAEPNPIGKDSYANMRARGSHTEPSTGYPSPSSGTTPKGVDGGEVPFNLHPQRDFLLESSTALCMFEMRIHVVMVHVIAGGGLQMGFPFRSSFTFVVPRSAFLGLIEKHAAQPKNSKAPVSDEASRASADAPPPVQVQGDVPASMAGSSTSTSRHQVPSMEPPSNIFDLLNDTMPAPEHNVPRQSDPPRVAYDVWGPACTRWFGSNDYDVSTRWITTSAGRRCVRMPAPRGLDDGLGPQEEGERFYVYDFNEKSVKAARERARKAKESVAAMEKDEAEERDGDDRRGDRKGKGRADGVSGEGTARGGDDGDDADDDAPRRDKGKGKAEVEDHPVRSTEPEDTRTHITRKNRRGLPFRGTLFGFPGVTLSDDEGSLAEDEASPEVGSDNAFQAEQNHNWTVKVDYADGSSEQHRLGERGDEPDLDNDDGWDIYPEPVSDERSASDRTMDMFLERMDAMGGVDQDDDMFYEQHSDDDDDDEAHLDGFSGRNEEDDHDSQISDQDHEVQSTGMHGTLGVDAFEPSPDADVEDGQFDPPFVVPGNAGEEPEPLSDREDWTFDILPSEGTFLLDEDSTLDCPDVFQHPVRHALPCIIRASQSPHQWNGVLLDEERVIGIFADPATGHVEEIEIHHFGAYSDQYSSVV